MKITTLVDTETAQRGGVLLIPGFAMGRAQILRPLCIKLQ